MGELTGGLGDGAGTWVARFVWGLDLSGSIGGAGGIGGLVLGETASGIHGVGVDGNGNVTTLFEASTGSVTGEFDYGPFGEDLGANGEAAASWPIRFSSKYRDAETGLYYYGYRYYNPTTGKWLTRDPLEEAGGLNLYGFVGNDPINAVDPWGLSDQWQWWESWVDYTGVGTVAHLIHDSVVLPAEGIGAWYCAYRRINSVKQLDSYAIEKGFDGLNNMRFMLAQRNGENLTAGASEVIDAVRELGIATAQVTLDAELLLAQMVQPKISLSTNQVERGPSRSFWERTPSKRGTAIENVAGYKKYKPCEGWRQTPHYYETWDFISRDGNSYVSMKSIDTSTPNYSKGSALKSVIKKYIDAAAEGTTLDRPSIARILDLVIPDSPLNSKQQKVLEEMFKYGKKNRVELRITTGMVK